MSGRQKLEEGAVGFKHPQGQFLPGGHPAELFLFELFHGPGMGSRFRGLAGGPGGLVLLGSRVPEADVIAVDLSTALGLGGSPLEKAEGLVIGIVGRNPRLFLDSAKTIFPRSQLLSRSKRQKNKSLQSKDLFGGEGESNRSRCSPFFSCLLPLSYIRERNNTRSIPGIFGRFPACSMGKCYNL